MTEAVLAFCKSNNIAILGSKTLMAVSGGLDSIILANLFQQIGVDFEIMHCNFNLRGQESIEDEQFVRSFASQIGVKCHIRNFEVAQYAHTKGISIQMAARELRYNWFEQLRIETNSRYIATAHHMGDVAETVLFNLSKGTGLEGLHGIKAISNSLIRPLLFASKKEIKSYALENNLKWREDSSNISTKYSRNKIRHAIIPVLEEINPRAQEAIYSTSLRISEAELFLNHQVKLLHDKLISHEGNHVIVDTKELLNTPGKFYILHEILKQFGFSYSQTSNVVSALGGLSGKLFNSISHVANIDRGKLIISPLTSDQGGISINSSASLYSVGNLSLSTRIIARSDYVINPAKNVLAFDMDILHFPLEVRVWEKGDVFYPLGMRGKKKLSDFMIDAKIPLNLKKHVWVVLSNELVAGIINHRLDDRFKITNKTKKVFEIICV